MNLAEFKAWFEGFTENMDGLPGPKEWARVCERVKEIKAEPTQFVLGYVPPPSWTSTWTSSVGSQEILNYPVPS